jgi:hypothetical protein
VGFTLVMHTIFSAPAVATSRSSNMTTDLVEVVRHYSMTIKNDRTLRSAYEHLREEVDELGSEICYIEAGIKPGEDGIVGEAMDVINCALDIIFQKHPDIDSQTLVDIMTRKCEKWQLKYGANNGD